MKVRVRYAPSPTGMQHIGGVRTALFNYLFAKANGGDFILRLEDTDRTRYGKEYEQNLYDTLSWLGVGWDEGPDKGGEYAPYTQSQRTELYKKYALELVQKGAAYYCFCDAERLERIRKIQSMNKMPPGYDRNCRSLTKEEIDSKLEAGVPRVIRLKIPLDGVTRFHDELLGDIEWKNEDVNPDPVLLKSDGFPTYHLANVIDDRLMRITHVMRAQEWIPSTPLHVMIYQAFGWEPPRYCHLPMVMGLDGQKLSKRHGATSCNEFRNSGYLPEALLNYIAMLGCSYEDGRDIYSLADLESLFRMEKLNKSPAVFDYKKLEWFNGQYIRSLTDEELYKRIIPFIADAGILNGTAQKGFFKDQTRAEITQSERDTIRASVPLIKERLRLLTDAPDMLRFLFEEPPVPQSADITPKRLTGEQTKNALEKAAAILETMENKDDEETEALFKQTAEALGIKLGDFMTPIRVAVTGSKISPPLIGSIRALGVDKARARVLKAAAAL